VKGRLLRWLNGTNCLLRGMQAAALVNAVKAGAGAKFSEKALKSLVGSQPISGWEGSKTETA